MLTQGHPERIHSNRLLYIGAILVLAGWSLAGWSLANAAPLAESLATARAAMANRAHSGRGIKLNIPVPALAATKAPPRPLPLDEPRPTRLNSEATSVLPENFRDRHRDGAPQFNATFPIQWRESREIVSADIVSLVRNYRRDGLPIVQLYQSQQNRLAIGLNNHGVPGIYFTRHIGG